MMEAPRSPRSGFCGSGRASGSAFASGKAKTEKKTSEAQRRNVDFMAESCVGDEDPYVTCRKNVRNQRQ
jgi:hypothetical protein